METIILALVIAGMGVIFHGIFTGLALFATWYFGHLAELKVLAEAKAIHKEVTDKIKAMDAADVEFDKIDAFMEEQKKVLGGFRSEIGRVVGEQLDGALKKIPTGGGAPGQPSALDKVLAIAAQFIPQD